MDQIKENRDAHLAAMIDRLQEKERHAALVRKNKELREELREELTAWASHKSWLPWSINVPPSSPSLLPRPALTLLRHPTDTQPCRLRGSNTSPPHHNTPRHQYSPLSVLSVDTNIINTHLESWINLLILEKMWEYGYYFVNTFFLKSICLSVYPSISLSIMVGEVHATIVLYCAYNFKHLVCNWLTFQFLKFDSTTIFLWKPSVLWVGCRLTFAVFPDDVMMMMFLCLCKEWQSVYLHHRLLEIATYPICISLTHTHLFSTRTLGT